MKKTVIIIVPMLNSELRMEAGWNTSAIALRVVIGEK
jgi:hypothetical protein